MFTLENDLLKLTCQTAGGEIKSLYDKKNHREVIYQGDEGWTGSNPSLFPIIGSTWQKTYTIAGKTYEMKNHGLIRYAVLEPQAEEDAIVFTYHSDENTKAQYPFDFAYKIKYELIENKVKISYEITNEGEEVMPFSFGLHPAFKTSHNNEEHFEDYTLTFNEPSKATQLVFDADFSPVKREEVELTEWQLSREDIDKYATIVYTDYDGHSVTLSCKGEPRIKVDYPDFPFLALWSHPSRSEFICIEPWFGHADFEKVPDDFYHREGTILLEPHETFKAAYTIEVL